MFLCTSIFFRLQYRAMNVLQLPEPSTASESGNEANRQERSQNFMVQLRMLP